MPVWREGGRRISAVIRVESPLNNTCVTSLWRYWAGSWHFVQQVKHSSHPVGSGGTDTATDSRDTYNPDACAPFFFFEGLYHSEEGSSNAEDPEDV